MDKVMVVAGSNFWLSQDQEKLQLVSSLPKTGSFPGRKPAHHLPIYIRAAVTK